MSASTSIERSRRDDAEPGYESTSATIRFARLCELRALIIHLDTTVWGGEEEARDLNCDGGPLRAIVVALDSTQGGEHDLALDISFQVPTLSNWDRWAWAALDTALVAFVDRHPHATVTVTCTHVVFGQASGPFASQVTARVRAPLPVQYLPNTHRHRAVVFASNVPRPLP